MDWEQMELVVRKVSSTEASTIVDGAHWVGEEGKAYEKKSEEMYNFIAPKLNFDLLGRLRQVGLVNGFELSRCLNKDWPGAAGARVLYGYCLAELVAREVEELCRDLRGHG